MGITPKNWEKFFYEKSEGLGTLYERIILHQFFRNLIEKYKIKTVLECPSFGMTGYSGINSWFFAKQGLEVYVADNDSKRLIFIRKIWRMANLNARFIKIENYEKLPFDNGQFDLVWNFAALWYLKYSNMNAVLNELARVCRKVIFISIPNRNIFYPLRKIIDKEFFRYVDELIINKIFIENIMKDEFSKYNFKLVEKGYFDTPPWPDFAIKVGDLFHPPAEGKGRITLPEYYEYIINPGLEKGILRFSFLERLPNFFKKIWSHHIYWTFVKL